MVLQKNSYRFSAIPLHPIQYRYVSYCHNLVSIVHPFVFCFLFTFQSSLKPLNLFDQHSSGMMYERSSKKSSSFCYDQMENMSAIDNHCPLYHKSFDTTLSSLKFCYFFLVSIWIIIIIKEIGNDNMLSKNYFDFVTNVFPRLKTCSDRISLSYFKENT